MCAPSSLPVSKESYECVGLRDHMMVGTAKRSLKRMRLTLMLNYLVPDQLSRSPTDDPSFSFPYGLGAYALIGLYLACLCEDLVEHEDSSEVETLMQDFDYKIRVGTRLNVTY